MSRALDANSTHYESTQINDRALTMDPSFRAGLSPRNVHAPIYFPPPPKSTTTVLETKKSVKLNFSKPRPSTETASSTSSVQPPTKSILKHKITSTKRPRQWILLSLLITSFTILILSMIFAYCAALPHSDNIQAAQAALQNANTTLKHRDTISSDNSNQTINDALAQDVANASKFNRPSALAALTFYTAALPLLTMLHTSTELLTSLIRPQTSQSTRLGDVLRFRQQAAQNAVTKRRIGTLLSFTASALLCLGWLIMQMFWLNCEITLFSAVSEGVCPVQIRGHRMGGVSELSIGKVALAFVVILGYAGYCVYLVRWAGVFGSKRADGTVTRTASFRRRARFARRADGDDAAAATAASGQERTVDGGVETVVIGIDVEKGLRQ